MGKRAFVDTNVLVYCYDADEPAKRARALFRQHGIKGLSVTTPNYSMAHSIDVNVPDIPHEPERHDCEQCPDCLAYRKATIQVGALILAAFPDLADRSDSQSDYFDFCYIVS